MARKTGQIIRRGPQMWMVRIYVGRDPEGRRRKCFGKSIHGGATGRTGPSQLHARGAGSRAQIFAPPGKPSTSISITARPRLRAKSFRDYSGLLARYVCEWAQDRSPSLASRYPDALQRVVQPEAVGTDDSLHAVLVSALREAC